MQICVAGMRTKCNVMKTIRRVNDTPASHPLCSTIFALAVAVALRLFASPSSSSPAASFQLPAQGNSGQGKFAAAANLVEGEGAGGTCVRPTTAWSIQRGRMAAEAAGRHESEQPWATVVAARYLRRPQIWQPGGAGCRSKFAAAANLERDPRKSLGSRGQKKPGRSRGIGGRAARWAGNQSEGPDARSRAFLIVRST